MPQTFARVGRRGAGRAHAIIVAKNHAKMVRVSLFSAALLSIVDALVPLPTVLPAEDARATPLLRIVDFGGGRGRPLHLKEVCVCVTLCAAGGGSPSDQIQGQARRIL